MADILQQKGQNKMKEKHLPFIQKKKKKKKKNPKANNLGSKKEITKDWWVMLHTLTYQ